MNARARFSIAVILLAISLPAAAQVPPVPETTPIQPILVEKIISVETDQFIYAFRNAREICFGAFELTNLPAGSVTVGRSGVGQGGIRYEFAVQLDGSSGARIYLYSPTVPRQYPVASLCNVNEEARAKATLTGRVASGAVRGSLIVGANGITQLALPKLKIVNSKVKEGMRMRLSEVTPQTRRYLGGTLRQTSSTVTVENPEAAVELASVDAMTGSIRIRNAGSFNLAVQLDTDRQELLFKTIAGKPMEVSVDLANGAAKLEEGMLTAAGFAPATPATPARQFSIGRVALKWGGVSANEATLNASKGTLALAFSGVKMTDVAGVHSAAPSVDITNAPSATVRKLSGSGEPLADGVRIVPQTIEALEIPAAVLSIGAEMRVRGPGKISVRSAGASGVDASLTFTAPVDVESAAGQPRAAELDELQIRGMTSGPGAGGSLNATLRELRLGTSILSTSNGKLKGTIAVDGTVDFQANVATPASLVVGKSEDGSAAFESAVTRAALKGTIDAGTMTFAKKDIALDVSGVTARRGRILGGRPDFGPGSMKLVNEDAVVVAQNGARGTLHFTTPLLRVIEPLIWTAARDFQLPLGTSDLVSLGATTLALLLGNGDIVPIGGGLSQDNIDIGLPPGVASVMFRLGGSDIEVRRFRISRLELRPVFDPATLQVTAALVANDIELDAGRVSHSSMPVFNGTVTQPISIGRLGGSVHIGRDPLAFDQIAVDRAKIELANASYATPDDVRIEAGTASLNLTHLDDGMARGELRMTGGSVHATGATNARASVGELALTFGGTKEAPLANGNLQLDNVDVVVNTAMPVASECGGNHLPLRISSQVGSLAGPISITGNKTEFLLATNSADVQLFRPIQDPWQCEWDHKVQDAVTIDHPCCETCWAGPFPYPCNCRTCTSVLIPAIHVRWQITVSSLNASGTVTQLKVKPDPQTKGIAFCEGHLASLNPPVVLFAVTPTIPGGNPISDAIRAGITLTQGAWQSALATTFGGIGSALSLTRIGNSFYLYDKCN